MHTDTPPVYGHSTPAHLTDAHCQQLNARKYRGSNESAWRWYTYVDGFILAVSI